MERRDFLQKAGALGAAAGLAKVAGAAGKAYDPAAKFDLEVSEVPYRRNAQGRELLARIYRPAGAGPFPVLLDLHGGAWQRKDRKAEEPVDRAIASSGVLVVAIDLTISGEAPYPACIQDASYGLRWLKWRAAEWRGDASTVGLYGSSTGGHIAELLAMRPNDARYNAIPLAEAPQVDTDVVYVGTRSPISNPFTRFQQAERKPNPNLVKASKAFFVPWESIHEASPQEILDRKERVTLKPLLIMQGELDDNVLPSEQRKFVDSYRAAGGEVQFEVFEGSVHEWVAEPGPQTTRAHEMMKAFIARNLRTGRS